MEETERKGENGAAAVVVVEITFGGNKKEFTQQKSNKPNEMGNMPQVDRFISFRSVPTMKENENEKGQNIGYLYKNKSFVQFTIKQAE